MVTISFRFPAGRYHATPWGHQVNEGLVEWPPCPWRLMRALIAVGHAKMGWDAIPPAGTRLLEKLGAVLPAYTLPSASLAHSRHYMPIGGGKTTLVLDTWLNVDGELIVHWPAELAEEERHLLKSLVERLGYLGRAESWVVGELVEREHEQLNANCFPYSPSGDRGPATSELVDLLAPISCDEYTSWREERLPPAPEGKLKKTQLKALENARAPFPDDLVSSLQWDTAKWKGFGWSQPPGSRWVQYSRPMGVLEGDVLVRSRRSEMTRVDIVMLALGTPSGNRSALPTLSRTLPQAELLHRTLVSRADPDRSGVAPPELSGRDEQRLPLDGHRHAHILPLDLDGDGHLDHVVLFAPMGFSGRALAAIRGVRRTWTKGFKDDLMIAIAGYGDRKRFDPLPHGLERILGKGRTWVSTTPFVPPRFLKKSGLHTMDGQVRAELYSRGIEEAFEMTVKRVPDSGDLDEYRRRQFRHFVRRRERSGTAPPQDMGFFIRLTFANDVEGPLCLGYGSHFGLGLFAVDNE